MNLREFERLREAVDTAKRERDQYAGALKTLEAQLKKEFDCRSLKEAEALLKDEQRAIAKDEEKYDLMLTDLKRDFPDLFEEG